MFGIVALMAFMGGTFQATADEFQCEGARDARKMLHLRARNKIEAFYCMGIAHAIDRSFQMSLYRRISRGERAERQGYQGIESDFFLRMMNFPDRARKIEAALSPKFRQKLEAYVQGVNKIWSRGESAVASGSDIWANSAETPDQFEPWSVRDTLTLLLLQSFDQTRRGLNEEIREWKASSKPFAVPPGDKTFPDRWFQKAIFEAPWFTPILKEVDTSLPEARPSESTEPSLMPTVPVSPLKKRGSAAREAGLDSVFALVAQAGQLDALEKFLSQDLLIGLGGGSNSWVVDGTRTKSKNAWFANDPHLGMVNPAFWLWTEVQVPSENLAIIGGSFPGIPIIISGAQQRDKPRQSVAWGLTNAYFDTIDLAAISVDEMDSIKSERPTIWFKLWKLKLPFVFKSFQRTPRQEFPVLPIDGPEGKKFVLKWSGFFLEAKEIEAAFDIPFVADANDLNKTLKQVRIPAWNFVFADSSGKIGYRAVGKVPDRKSESVEGVVESTLKEWDQPYSQYWDENEIPNLFRPTRGYIATANQPQWGPLRPKSLGRVGAESFRAFRVEELLTEKDLKHDFESLRKIQCDQQAVDARFFAKILAETVPPLDRAIRYQLEQWDFDTQVDCRICGLYRRWMERLMEDTSLNESQLYFVFQKRKDLILPAVEKAYVQAKKDLGILEPTQIPRWGQIHRARFLTALGDGFDPFIPSPVGLETAGDKHSVNPGESKFTDRIYEQEWGASHRLLVELGPKARIFLSFPGTTTETLRRDFTSPDSPWVEWKNCIYHPVEVAMGDDTSSLKWTALPAEKVVP